MSNLNRRKFLAAAGASIAAGSLAIPAAKAPQWLADPSMYRINDDMPVCGFDPGAGDDHTAMAMFVPHGYEKDVLKFFRINAPGGPASDGKTIFRALLPHDPKVVAAT